MSLFGPNQVGFLAIGNEVATETTLATFKATASDKEVKALSVDGTAPTLGKSFRVYQKALEASDGYEFTDIVNPKHIERITISNFLAETQKQVAVAGFTGNIVANTTYEVEVRVYAEGGSLSAENFSVVQGFYVTGASVAGLTDADIRDGLLKSLNQNIDSRGGDEFITAETAVPIGFTVTGKYQENVLGKIPGRQIEFDVIAKTYSNEGDPQMISQNTGLLTTVVNAQNNPGVGTGKFVTNYEWFTKGNKYEPYRDMAYPVNFDTPYYGDKAGEYDVIDIKYFNPRKQTGVERQYKVLSVALTAGTLAFVTDLETITGVTLTNPGTNLL